MMHSKVLHITTTSSFSCKGYTLLQSTIDGDKVIKVGRVLDKKYACFSECALTRRLLRAEITGLYLLLDNSIIAIAKKGLFRRSSVGGNFLKTFSMSKGSKPLNLCILPNGNIFFGEYFQNVDKVAVNIYGSKDNGYTWEAVYTFADGNINHVHGVFYDNYTDRLWVVTGDRENECIIGYTEDEFKTFTEVFRGGQEYRTCHLFFYKDFIVFATDSQYIQNEIKCFDRGSLEIRSLAKIQGSAIKGGQSGNVSFLATTVEPSKVNTERSSHLWYTKDGLNWIDAISYKKDCWPSIFQFGTIEFPNYYGPITDKLWYSGRALKGLDGKSTYIEI